MRKIILISAMLWGYVMAQTCDTTSSITLSNITQTSGRAVVAPVTGATAYVWGVYYGVSLVTGGSSASTVINFTGLTAGRAYTIKIGTACGILSSPSPIPTRSFSTAGAKIVYTPMDAAGYQYKYGMFDSGLIIPNRDTSTYRGATRPGALTYKNNYGLAVWDGSRWSNVGNDTTRILYSSDSTIILSYSANRDSINAVVDTSKVATITYVTNIVTASDSSGWRTNGNTGTDSNSNFIGTTDLQPLSVKINNTQVARFGINTSNVAIGSGAVASGEASIAIGAASNASGDGAISLGQNNAIGIGALATGSGCFADGDVSTSMGLSTMADGLASMATGYSSVAIGDYSTAMNLQTIARSKNSLVIGRYNDTTGHADNDTSVLFQIGNGYQGVDLTVLSNILSVGYNGLLIGNHTSQLPTATLQITGSDTNVIKTSRLSNTVLSTDSMVVRDLATGNFKVAVKPSGTSGITALTGDVTASGTGSVAATLATVNSNVGTFGSATQVGTFTVNGKGLITAASNTTVTPAVGSITGLGTGVATWLATPSSANLLAALTTKTGTGNAMFSIAPTSTGLLTIDSMKVNNLIYFGTSRTTTSPINLDPTNTASTGGIAFGTSHTLYRNAANQTTLTGTVFNTPGITMASGAALLFGTRGGFDPSADGIMRIYNNAATGFTRLCLGLATSSFPALSRSGTTMAVVLADGSGDAPMTASNGGFSGNITLTGATSTLQLKSYTVAGLPAAGTAGRIAYVSDALAPTYNATIVGGGAIGTMVLDNGTNWTAH